MARPTRTAADKIRQALKIAGAGSIGFTSICLYKSDPGFYSNFLMPTFQKFTDGERAHNLAIWAAKNGLMIPPPEVRKNGCPTGESIKSRVFEVDFPNPLGIGAGFDKHGEAVEGLHDVGFGFVEIGSVTPEPQPGNGKPRVFRLQEDGAVINRYGFNSEGHEVVRNRIQKMREETGTKGKKIVLGVNLGKNKTSPVDGIDDYVKGVRNFAGLADYLVVNVSSPNTAGLRNLQEKNNLSTLIKEILTARDSLKLPRPVPVLLKIAPDLTEDDMTDIAEVIVKNKVDGVIVSNTTISRPGSLQSSNKQEVGGLSGRPLRDKSTEAIGKMYKLTSGKIPIIGVGGVASGQDAYEKICAGASLVQLYTSFTYHGPPLPHKIIKDLQTILKKDGHQNISSAVGSNHKG